MKVYVINGPNINLLGTREPEIYGYETLDDISEKCIEIGKKKGIDVKFMQSNYEGDLVSWIQDAIKNKIDLFYESVISKIYNLDLNTNKKESLLNFVNKIVYREF